MNSTLLLNRVEAQQEQIKTKKHTHKRKKYTQRDSIALRHFTSIGQHQKRSQLTKAWVIALLHKHNEHNNENCCLRIIAKKVIAPCCTHNWLALHQVGILNKSRKALLKATCMRRNGKVKLINYYLMTSHRRRSSVNFRGHDIFARKKYAWNINKMPEFYMILARKIRKIPEFL